MTCCVFLQHFECHISTFNTFRDGRAQTLRTLAWKPDFLGSNLDLETLLAV